MKGTPTPEPSKKHCEVGWLETDDGCYQFGEKDDLRTWQNASEGVIELEEYIIL